MTELEYRIFMIAFGIAVIVIILSGRVARQRRTLGVGGMCGRDINERRN